MQCINIASTLQLLNRSTDQEAMSSLPPKYALGTAPDFGSLRWTRIVRTMSAFRSYSDHQQNTAGARKGARSDSVVCPSRVKGRRSAESPSGSEMRRRTDISAGGAASVGNAAATGPSLGAWRTSRLCHESTFRHERISGYALS
jgi:hypothetical protein